MLLPLQSHTLPTSGPGLGRSGTPFRGSTLGFSPSQARRNRLRRWCRQTGPQRWGSAMGVGMGPDQRGQMDAGVRRAAPRNTTLSAATGSRLRAHMGPGRAPLHPRWNRAGGGRTRSSRGATSPGTKRLHKRSVTQLPRPLLLSQQSSLSAAAPLLSACTCIGGFGLLPEVAHSWGSLGRGAGGGVVRLPPSLLQGGAHTDWAGYPVAPWAEHSTRRSFCFEALCQVRPSPI